jgi:hypothetical protein
VNTIIELHDSTVAEIVKQGDMVSVHFLPAYLHKSESRPGIDSGTGWIQGARLIFTNAFISGVMPEFPSNIIDGDLSICTEPHNNEIPVPLDATGPVVLHLTFDSIHKVTIEGSDVRLELLGEPKCVEEGPKSSSA